MTYRKRMFVALAGITLAFAGGCTVLLCLSSFRLPDLCGNKELETIYSPDGDRKAVVFKRDCGATTGFSTNVSLLRSKQILPNEAGNIFIADTDHEKAVSGPGGGPIVGVRWAEDGELALSYSPSARVFRSRQSLHGVTIRYEQQR